MATALPLNYEIDTNTNNNHLEIFSLIWLDGDVNANGSRDIEQKLRSVINYLKKFQDIKQCQKYIEQTTQKDRLILVVGGQMGQEIVPLIHHLRQVISIYIYCLDKRKHEEWTCEYRKVNAYLTNIAFYLYYFFKGQRCYCRI